MTFEKTALFHFKAVHSKHAETPDDKGIRKLCFISEEHNNELHLFLWIDDDNRPLAFQFFFFEKVLAWNTTSGLTTNVTNRLEDSLTDNKTGFLKGTRTLKPVKNPSILNEGVEIISKSVFPLGIAEILELKIKEAGHK